MKIRKAKLNDLNKLYKLMNSAKEIQTTNKKVYSKNLIKNCIKDPSVYFFVIEYNKKVIGVSLAALWKNIGTSYWDSIVIDKNFRGKNL